MNTPNPQNWRPLRLAAVGSVIVWVAAVAAADKYLTWMVAEEYRTGARTSTDADFIGLPLAAFAILLGVLLLVINLAVLVWVWRKRRGVSASRPAL